MSGGLRPNETCEAYTGNFSGRKGIRTSLKQYSLVKDKMQAATVLTCRKPTQRNRYIYRNRKRDQTFMGDW